MTFGKAFYILGLGEQSGVLKDSMIKVCLGYRNTDEIFKLLKKKIMNHIPLCRHKGPECRWPFLGAGLLYLLSIWDFCVYFAPFTFDIISSSFTSYVSLSNRIVHSCCSNAQVLGSTFVPILVQCFPQPCKY